MPVRRDRLGRWFYRKRVKLPDGTRQDISGWPSRDTRLAAEQAERAHIDRVLNPPPAPPKEVPRFRDFVETRWLPTYPAAAGNRPSTVREKEIHLRVHLLPALGKLRLDQVRGEPVERFLAGLRAKGMAPKSIKNIRATLRRILASAHEWGEIPGVPPLPKVKVPEPRFDFLVPDESAAILGAARTIEERALLLFAMHTGARAGEQLAVEWGDLDWHNKQVVFRRSSTRGVVGPTKNGRERRVPMTRTLETTLHDLRGLCHLRGGLVFRREDGRPLSLWQLHERLWGACRRAGLREIRWHDLRHTFASQLVMAGVPLRQVQEWLGHSTITMTMRYSHMAPGTGEAIRVLDEPSTRRAVAVALQCGPEGGRRPAQVAVLAGKSGATPAGFEPRS